jgi:hypothetical protein
MPATLQIMASGVRSLPFLFGFGTPQAGAALIGCRMPKEKSKAAILAALQNHTLPQRQEEYKLPAGVNPEGMLGDNPGNVLKERPACPNP